MSTTTMPTYEGILQSPLVKRYLGEIDNDVDAALITSDSQLRSSVMRDYPSKIVSEYKSDVKALESAYSDFNDALYDIDHGQARDLRAFEQTYQKLLLALEVVEAQNADHKVLIDLDVARKLSALMTVLSPVLGKGRTFAEMQSKLSSLESDLKKAKKKIVSKSAKTACDAALTAVTLLAPPMGIGGRLTMVVATKVVSDSIGSTFGSGRQPDSQKQAFDSAVSVMKVQGTLNGVPARTLAGLTGFANVALDAGEVAEAVKLKKTIDKKIKEFMKQYDATKKELDRQTKQLATLHRDAERAYQQAVSQMGRSSSSATSKRKNLLKEVKSY